MRCRQDIARQRDSQINTRADHWARRKSNSISHLRISSAELSFFSGLCVLWLKLEAFYLAFTNRISRAAKLG